jgi:uncharacterized protein (DUF1499 family)
VQAKFLAIQTMPYTTLITNEPSYIHAEFSSLTMRFVGEWNFPSMRWLA